MPHESLEYKLPGELPEVARDAPAVCGNLTRRNEFTIEKQHNNTKCSATEMYAIQKIDIDTVQALRTLHLESGGIS